MSDAFENLVLEKEDGIGWLTLNRPRVLNAVNLAMRDELWTAFESLRIDPDVGVIVLKGAGERAFSAGADISEFGTAPSFIEARRARRERDVWGLMLAIEKPIIAAIHGYALGAGCEMSLCCDLRIASEDAVIGLPEVGLGYLPSAGGTQTLPRAIGPGRALHMVLSGEPVRAPEALEAGLVQWVVPGEELHDKARDLASRILTQPASVIRLTKAAVRQGLDLPLDEGLRLEARLRLVAGAASPGFTYR
jgi:enoyl-CoA hydratase